MHTNIDLYACVYDLESYVREYRCWSYIGIKADFRYLFFSATRLRSDEVETCPSIVREQVFVLYSISSRHDTS